MSAAIIKLKSMASVKTKTRLKRLFGVDPTRSLLKKLEKIYGPLSTGDRRCCNEYAASVLGSRTYAPWLYVYSVLAGEFKQGWIPDSYYGRVVVPALKGAYGDVCDLNALQAIIFGASFPDLVYQVNGILLDKSMRAVSASEAKSRLFGISDKVVFKSDSSRQGRGVEILSESNFSLEALSSLGNGVLQAYIRQHAFFAEFHAGSVATLRMTTAANDGGEVSLRASYLRFGQGTDTHVKSASHVRVPVDTESGKLSSTGYTAGWVAVGEHPDSGRGFENRVVPCFAACIAKVIEMHKRLPFVRCIGWDVVVDSDGEVQVMEWNGAHNDIKFSEVTQGPCFSDLGWQHLWRS